jgi:hypothetical protein
MGLERFLDNIESDTPIDGVNEQPLGNISEQPIEDVNEQELQGKKYENIGTIHTVEEAIRAAKAIRVKYIENELEKADGVEEKLEIIDSWPVHEEWNEYKEEITTTHSSTLPRQTSLTRNDIYIKAGAHPGQFAPSSSNFKYKVLGDLYYAAFIFGPDFTQKEFNSINWLTNSSSLERTLDKTFNQIKDELDLDVNQDRNLSPAHIKAEINDNFDSLETVTEDKIDNRCSFSHHVIAQRFGRGSLVDGLSSLGFDPTDEQVNRSKGNTKINSPRQQANNILDQIGVSEDCDGYVYLLKCTDDESKVRFYVGSVGMGKSISKRIHQHIRCGGDFTAKICEEDRWKILQFSEFDWDIEVKSVKCLDSGDMSREEFKEHIRGLEFAKMKECSRRLDEPVLGGT